MTQKWLEILSSGKTSSPECEICHFHYKRHRRVKVIVLKSEHHKYIHLYLVKQVHNSLLLKEGQNFTFNIFLFNPDDGWVLFSHHQFFKSGMNIRRGKNKSFYLSKLVYQANPIFLASLI